MIETVMAKGVVCLKQYYFHMVALNKEKNHSKKSYISIQKNTKFVELT